MKPSDILSIHKNDLVLKDIHNENMKNGLSKADDGNRKINQELTSLWYSYDQNKWDSALDNYWNFVKAINLNLEMKMEELDWKLIKLYDVDSFFNFLYDEYFVWKYTAPNRLATTRNQLQRYKTEQRMSELNNIKEQLFSFDQNDIEEGLRIVQQIKGLGVAGAAGLLSLLFPWNYGTVDQFAVKALLSIDKIAEINLLIGMKPDSLRTRDGVILIKIMKKTSKNLNEYNKTDYWTPRKIDKVLWTFGR